MSYDVDQAGTGCPREGIRVWDTEGDAPPTLPREDEGKDQSAASTPQVNSKR